MEQENGSLQPPIYPSVPLEDNYETQNMPPSYPQLYGNNVPLAYPFPPPVQSPSKPIRELEVFTSDALIEEQHVRDRLVEREYQVTTWKWVKQAWQLYKQKWFLFSLFTLFYVAISSFGMIGSLVSFYLSFGTYIAGSHMVRGTVNQFYPQSLFHGLYFFFPVLIMTFVMSLLIVFGLLLFVVPGLYLMIALQFTHKVYIEFHQEGLSIFDAITVTRQVLHKHFWGILLYTMAMLGLVLLGTAGLLIGLLVTLPIIELTSIFAIQDIFGPSHGRKLDGNCLCI
jgi:hypothetical protein